MPITKLVFVLFFVVFAEQSRAFQVYSGERLGNSQIDPAIKTFRYYISPTYWDLLSSREKPISDFLIDNVKFSFDVLNRDLAEIGVKFEFAGLQDVYALHDMDQGDEFQATIYVDFTSRNFTSSPGAFAGKTSSRKLNPADLYDVGGIIHMNGKKLNWHHPLVEGFSTIMHETLHILGVGHSTNASATMAYTENWSPRLSKDDISAVATVYQVTTGAAPSVTAYLNNEPAMGVEVVWIEASTGKSQIVVTDRKGVAKVYGLPAGTYYLASRELTPTGPCFESPVQGFLTSFYQNDTTSTNEFSQAATIAVQEGTSAKYSIKLIPGKKKFDCHFVYAMWCTDSAKCSQNRFHSGVTGRANIQNDLTATNHKTDTDTGSGAHSTIQLSVIGSQSPISLGTSSLGDGVTEASVGYNMLNYTVADATISAAADESTYAGLCSAQSETALVSSLVEVMSGPLYINNRTLWPQYESDFTDSSAPRNYEEMVLVEAPAKPKKVLGIACGTVKNEPLRNDSKGGLLVVLTLIAPLFIQFFSRAILEKILLGGLIVLGFFAGNTKPAMAFSINSGVWFEQELESETSSTTRTRYKFSLSPLQHLAYGVNVGGKFIYNAVSSKSDSVSQNETFTTVGPTIAVIPPSASYLYGAFSYLLWPTTTIKADSEITHFGGTGVALDVGFRVPVAKILLGPLITYQSTTFKQENTEFSERAVDLKKTDVSLLLGLWWEL